MAQRIARCLAFCCICTATRVQLLKKSTRSATRLHLLKAHSLTCKPAVSICNVLSAASCGRVSANVKFQVWVWQILIQARSWYIRVHIPLQHIWKNKKSLLCEPVLIIRTFLKAAFCVSFTRRNVPLKGEKLTPRYCVSPHRFRSALIT